MADRLPTTVRGAPEDGFKDLLHAHVVTSVAKLWVFDRGEVESETGEWVVRIKGDVPPMKVHSDVLLVWLRRGGTFFLPLVFCPVSECASSEVVETAAVPRVLPP